MEKISQEDVEKLLQNRKAAQEALSNRPTLGQQTKTTHRRTLTLTISSADAGPIATGVMKALKSVAQSIEERYTETKVTVNLSE